MMGCFGREGLLLFVMALTTYLTISLNLTDLQLQLYIHKKQKKQKPNDDTTTIYRIII